MRKQSTHHSVTDDNTCNVPMVYIVCINDWLLESDKSVGPGVISGVQSSAIL